MLEHLDDSPESVLLESMIEGLNEYYSKNLAREVEKGKAENALKAKHIGGNKIARCPIDGATNAQDDIFAEIVYVNPLLLWASKKSVERIVYEIGKIEDWLPSFLSGRVE